MAKTSKQSRATAATQSEAASVPPSAHNPDKEAPGGPVARRVSGAKSSKTTGKSKAAGRRAPRPARKTQATRKPSNGTPAAANDVSRQTKISDDDIRLRAYFIAERRMQSGVPGDSTHDWWRRTASCRRKRARTTSQASSRSRDHSSVWDRLLHFFKESVDRERLRQKPANSRLST